MNDPSAFTWMAVELGGIPDNLWAYAAEMQGELKRYEARYWAALGGREPEHDFSHLPLPRLPCAVAITRYGKLKDIALFGNHKGILTWRMVTKADEPNREFWDYDDEEGGSQPSDATVILGEIARRTSAEAPTYSCTPSPKNAGRIKRGKRPLYEFSTVVIPKPRPLYSDGKGGTHASPRLHERRGHFRKLKSGAEVWVRACKVGDVSNGAVLQTYVVR